MKTTIGVLLIIALEGCITVQPCVCPQVEKIEQSYYQPQFYPQKFNTIPYKGIYLGEGDTTITWRFPLVGRGDIPRFLSGDTLRLTPQNEIIKLRKLQ